MFFEVRHVKLKLVTILVGVHMRKMAMVFVSYS